jgi:tryptophan synthase alpha chain
MSRIAALFERLRGEGRKALVPFVTAGDPSRESTVAVMHGLVAGGADLIELGVPFSDPMADGPVIQRSSERALARKVGTAEVFGFVREFRRDDALTPVVLMGYLNPIEMRGPEKYAEQACAAGVDGLLLVDLPPEEAAPLREAFNRHGLELISLAAPTTSPERLQRLAETSQGYLYYVSFAGVTGASIIDATEVATRAGALRAMSRVPVLIGFGIKDATSAAAMAPLADGIVVGSALVEHLSVAESADEARQRARDFLEPLRAALDGLNWPSHTARVAS